MKDVSWNFSELNFARVAIIGCPGSGKTTFSNQLQRILDREVVHLDKLLWQPNWQLPEFDTRAKIHAELIAKEQWIIDGMWKSHLTERVSRATLVIYLDYKRSLCLKRVLARRIKNNGKQREDIAEGCLEKLDSEFLKFVWNFNKVTRPQILQLVEQNAVQTVVLNNPKQTQAFQLQLERFLQSQNN